MHLSDDPLAVLFAPQAIGATRRFGTRLLDDSKATLLLCCPYWTKSTHPMRALALLVCCLLPTSGIAQVAADWSVFPGYFSPGGRGIVTVDLDGVGNPEAVVTGSTVGGFGFSQNLHLATLEHTGTRYRTTHLLPIAAGWSFSGPVQAFRMAPASVDRVVVSLRQNSGQQAAIVTYGGKPLREIARTPAPVNFSLRQLADIDGDGQLEALGCNCADFNQGPAILLDYATGNVEWTDGSPAEFVGAGQLDDDPALEIALGSQSVFPSTPGRILDGATRAQQWAYPDGFRGQPVFGNFRGSPDAREFAIIERWGVTRIFISQPILSPVAEINTGEVGAFAVHDVNNDGYAELIIGQGQWGSVVAYSTTTGQTVFSWPNGDHGVSAIALGNLDGQAGLELVYGAGLTSSGRDVLRVIDVASGAVRAEFVDEAGPHSSVLRVDIEGDGSDELVYMTRQTSSGFGGGSLVVLDAATGAEHRRRASALDNGFASGSGLLKAIDIDNDGVKEIVGARGTAVAVLNGLNLADRWRVSNLPAVVNDLGLMRLNSDSVDDIVVGLDNRVLVLNGATGSELYRSVSFNATSSSRVAIGNADADPQQEIAFGLGANVYVIDATAGLVESFFTAAQPVRGIRYETLAGQCQLVLTLADRIDRRDCATGVPLSTRMLGMTAEYVGFATDSFGDLIVSDGQRVHRMAAGPFMWSSSEFGTSLGFGNLGEVRVEGENLVVHIGGDQSVNRITMPVANAEVPLFASGFENP